MKTSAVSKATRREWIGLGVIALPCLLYSMATVTHALELTAAISAVLVAAMAAVIVLRLRPVSVLARP